MKERKIIFTDVFTDVVVVFAYKVPNKGGRAQRKRKEIGADWLVCARFARVFVASPLSRALDKTAMLCRLGVSVSLAVKIVCLRLS